MCLADINSETGQVCLDYVTYFFRISVSVASYKLA